MQTRVVVVHADRAPMAGVANPGPHQTYRNPRVVVETRELQELHPDEIRVRMIYAGVCGTDVHVVETNPQTGYIRCSAPVKITEKGRILGHEGVGEVLKTGAHVRHVREGQYVTFESIIVCHYCDVCRRGQFNQCRRARLLGLEKDGLFGAVVDLPSMLTHAIGAMAESDVGLRAAACVEPAGVAYVACENTRVAGGDVVVVFGAGPIGALAAMLAKVVFGAARVYVVEPIPFRREFVRRWCDRAYDVQEFFADPPKAIDVLIEASGVMENVTRTFRQLNANGRVALLARSGQPLSLDAIDYMITNAISLIGSRGHLCGAFAKIINLYQNGRIPLDEIVTGVVEGPEELCSLLETPQRIFDENCKVLVKF